MSHGLLHSTFAFTLLTVSLEATAAEESASPQKAPAAQPAHAPEAAPAEPKATVVVNTESNHATIERRVNTSSYSGLPLADASFGSISQWEQVCVAPCERPLDKRHSYRIAGEGLVPSDSFTLPRERDRLTLDAKMGSSYGRLAGIGLTLLGASGMLLGGGATIASPILESQDAGSKGLRTGLLAGGITVLSAGLVSAGVGVYLWATNATTIKPMRDTARATKPHLTPAGLAF